MASKQINPFFAILFLTVIAGTGTLFVVNKIATTPLTYGVTPTHSPASHFRAQIRNAEIKAQQQGQ
jgi:hypothetical protein